jgi:hypothetical protein
MPQLPQNFQWPGNVILASTLGLTGEFPDTLTYENRAYRKIGPTYYLDPTLLRANNTIVEANRIVIGYVYETSPQLGSVEKLRIGDDSLTASAN